MDECMKEVVAFWRELMADGSQKISDRLKASENLARLCEREAAGDAPEPDRELRIFVDYGGLPCS